MEFWLEQGRIYERLKGVRQVMLAAIPETGRLPAIARAQVENEGKMLRPALLLLAAGLSTRPGEALRLAAALEYFHVASLVHDDIVDQAKERRGAPAVAEQHGISLALYTGDYLIWLAVKCLSGVDKALVPDRLMEFMSPLLEAEAEQLETRYSLTISEDAYLRRIAAKTGLLFSYGAVAGYGLKSRDREALEQVKQAGLDLGVAFQLRDDLKDLADPGHPDLKEGNYTLPVLLAMQVDPMIGTLLEEARRTKAAKLYQAIVARTLAAGGKARTEEAIQNHAEAAAGVFRKFLGAEEWPIYQWMTGKLYGGEEWKSMPTPRST